MPPSQTARGLIDEARRRGRQALDEPTAKRILALYGIRVPRFAVIKRTEELDEALSRFAEPLALKLISPDVLHKSDVAGVRLGLRHRDEIAGGMSEMAARSARMGYRLEGFLLEEMAPPGHDLVVGGFRDPSFGQVIMVGLGGIFVEVLRDVAFRICPITPLDAREMLAELKGAAVLRGARAGTVVPDFVVIDALMAVGGEGGLLVDLADRLAEVDINPLIVSAAGAVAVDARFVLESEAGDEH